MLSWLRPAHLMDEQRMLEQIKEFFRSFLALQIEAVRGDIHAAEAKTAAVDTKVEAYRREILAEFRRLEEKVDVRLGAMAEKLETRLGAMEMKLDARLELMDQRLIGIDQRFVAVDQRFIAVDQRFVAIDQRLDMMDQKLDLMNQKLDLLRKELLAEIRAAIR